jgi:hypothetical protein
MQRNSLLFRRHDLVAVLMTISGICGGVSAFTPVVAVGNGSTPALLIELSGPTAAKLAALGYAEPVLVAYTDNGWAAVVFSEDPDDLQPLVDKLLVPGVPGSDCVPEGPAACCADNGDFLLNTTRGWLRLGERCKAPTEDDEGVNVEKLPAALAEELRACCRIAYEYMNLANPDGTARLLWDESLSKKDELPLPLRTMHGAGIPRVFSISLPVAEGPPAKAIPVHGGHPAPSQSCLNNEPSSCKQRDNKVCHQTQNHWYVKSRTTNQWCFDTPCTC